MGFIIKGFFKKKIFRECFKWEFILLTISFYVLFFYSLLINSTYEYISLFYDRSHSSISFFLFLWKFFVNLILLIRLKRYFISETRNERINSRINISYNQFSLSLLQMHFIFVSLFFFIIFYFMATFFFPSVNSKSNLFLNYLFELFLYNVSNIEIIMILNILMIFILIPMDLILLQKG